MQSGAQGRGRDSGHQSGGGSFYEQAGDMVGGVTERASDLWDDAYEHGEEYYRQGRRAIGRLDGVTLAGLAAAGALGIAVAWMMFGGRSGRNAEWMDEPKGKRARRRNNGRHGQGRHGHRSHG
jgi:hypothetical protein